MKNNKLIFLIIITLFLLTACGKKIISPFVKLETRDAVPIIIRGQNINNKTFDVKVTANDVDITEYCNISYRYDKDVVGLQDIYITASCGNYFGNICTARQIKILP